MQFVVCVYENIVILKPFFAHQWENVKKLIFKNEI